MISFLLTTHILAGFASILLFWVPAFSRKGGSLHLRSGKGYVYAMWIVVVTALILCFIRIAGGQYDAAMFLGFLALITAKPLWHGIAVLRRPGPAFWTIKTALELALFAAGLLMAGLGLLWWGSGGSVLMLLFGTLGALNYSEWQRSRRKVHRHNRIQSHLSGMIISGIAAHTAFFAFGARSYLSALLSESWQIVPWVLPTILGVIAIRLLLPRYERRKAGKLQPATAEERK